MLAIVLLAYEAAIAVEGDRAHPVAPECLSTPGCLEWTSAAHSAGEKNVSQTRLGTWREMAAAPLIAAAIALMLAWLNPAALFGGGGRCSSCGLPRPKLPGSSAASSTRISETLKPEDRRYLRPRRAAHMALFRDLRGTRRQLAAARQLPGQPARGNRAPHLSHQCGHAVPFRADGVGSGSHRTA